MSQSFNQLRALLAVAAEAAGSSPVVPAILFNSRRSLSRFLDRVWGSVPPNISLSFSHSSCGQRNMRACIATSQSIAAILAAQNFSWLPADLQETIPAGRAG